MLDEGASSKRFHMWDISRFVMIVLLSLHRGETLSFGAYKLLVKLISCDPGAYSGVYKTESKILSSPLLFHMLACDLTGCSSEF